MTNISKKDLQKIIRYKLLENYKKQLNELGGNEKNFLTHDNFKFPKISSQEKIYFPIIDTEEVDSLIYKEFVNNSKNLTNFKIFNEIWSNKNEDEDTKLNNIKKEFEKVIKIYKCHTASDEKRFTGFKLHEYNISSHEPNQNPTEYDDQNSNSFLIPIDLKKEEFFIKTKKILGSKIGDRLIDRNLYSSNNEEIIYFYDFINKILYFKMKDDLNEKICDQLSDNILDNVKSIFGDDDWIDYLEGDITNIRAIGGNLQEDENLLTELLIDTVLYILFVGSTKVMSNVINKIPGISTLKQKGLSTMSSFLIFLKNQKILKKFLSLDTNTTKTFFNILSEKLLGKKIWENIKLSDSQKSTLKIIFDSIKNIVEVEFFKHFPEEVEKYHRKKDQENQEKIENNSIQQDHHKKNKNIIKEIAPVAATAAIATRIGLIITTLNSIVNSIDSSRVWPQIEHWYAIKLPFQNIPSLKKYIQHYLAIETLNNLRQNDNESTENIDSTIQTISTKLNIKPNICYQIYLLTKKDYIKDNQNNNEKTSSNDSNQNIIQDDNDEKLISGTKNFCKTLDISYNDDINILKKEFEEKLNIKLPNNISSLHQLMTIVTEQLQKINTNTDIKDK